MAILKFKKEALEEMKKSFDTNEMESIMILIEGKTKCNSITKKHLATFRKFFEILCHKLNWNDTEVTNEDTYKNDERLDLQNNDSQNNDTQNYELQNIDSEITTVQKKEETCKYYLSGNCKYGRSGNTHDQRGKICSYSHPTICNNHEKFGKCYDNRCKKTHLSLCRDYMKTLECKYENRCRFFHPKKLKDSRMEHRRNKSFANEENQMQKPSLAQNQESSFQSTFLDFMKSQREILWKLEQLDIQSKNIIKQRPKSGW